MDWILAVNPILYSSAVLDCIHYTNVNGCVSCVGCVLLPDDWGQKWQYSINTVWTNHHSYLLDP